jgi:kinetochore protein Nuf2
MRQTSEDVSTELQKEEGEPKGCKHRDALSERGNNVREVERTEALLQRQLTRWMERTETLRKGRGENARCEEDGGAEECASEVNRGAGDKGREMERRRLGSRQRRRYVFLESLWAVRFGKWC